MNFETFYKEEIEGEPLSYESCEMIWDHQQDRIQKMEQTLSKLEKQHKLLSEAHIELQDSYAEIYYKNEEQQQKVIENIRKQLDETDKEFARRAKDVLYVIDKLEKVRVFYGRLGNWHGGGHKNSILKLDVEDIKSLLNDDIKLGYYGGKLAREVGEDELVKKYTGGEG